MREVYQYARTAFINTAIIALNLIVFLYLEFLGLEREAAYYEKDFESAIITHLQHFLLELGQGFTFVARQKRILLEDDEFFADLVFYNRLLRCFVVIELKTGKLTHQDLGQLQMYVK